MKKLLGRLRSNKDGSVLLAVITIMSFAAVLSATAFSFVQQASNQSYRNYNEKQAYYTASTCLETFVDAILTPGSTQSEQFANIATGTSIVSEPIELEGMGTCTISVEKTTTGMVKIIAKANAGGQEESVACYLKENTSTQKASFTNAVEITGASSSGFNNFSVFGDMAGTNNTNPNQLYSFRNDTNMKGKLFQYGTIMNTVNMSFTDSLSGEGTSLTATEYIYLASNNFNMTSSIMKRNDNSTNYLNAGQAFVVAAPNTYVGESSNPVAENDNVKPKDIDVYGGGVIIGGNLSTISAKTQQVNSRLREITNSYGDISGNSNYTQYGNVYCYNNGGIMGGDMVVGYKTTVYGDVYVEGDLYVNPAGDAEFVVYGNLYVGGQITGKSPVMYADSTRSESTGKIYCNNYGTNSLPDSTFTSVKTSARGKTPTLEYDGTEYIYYAEDLLISSDPAVSSISDKYLAVVRNKEEYKITEKFANTKATIDNQEFDYVVNDSCYIEWMDNTQILIDVTEASGDIVVVFANGISTSNDNLIIVRNQTKSFEDEEGKKPSFCYFTVDTYQEGAKVTPIKDKGVVVDSEHTGFVTSANATFSKTHIIDYDTWINCVKGSMAYNITNAEPTQGNVYSPEHTYIVYLLTEGTTWYGKNNTLFEGTFFARQASVSLEMGLGIKVYTGSGVENKQFTNLGAVIASSVKVNETNYIAFVPPSNHSDLSNVGGADANDQAQYEIYKYTQNLS